MKKLFLSLAVVFGVAMVSCGDGQKNDAANTEVEAVEVEAVNPAQEGEQAPAPEGEQAQAQEGEQAPAPEGEQAPAPEGEQAPQQ